MAATNLSVINQICIDLGGTGGHVTNLTGINEICTILGATSGHVTNLSGLNAICTVMGYTSGHVTNLRALNEICTGGGGTGGHFLEYNAWVEIQVGALLKYNPEQDATVNLLASGRTGFTMPATVGEPVQILTPTFKGFGSQRPKGDKTKVAEHLFDGGSYTLYFRFKVITWTTGTYFAILGCGTSSSTRGLSLYNYGTNIYFECWDGASHGAENIILTNADTVLPSAGWCDMQIVVDYDLKQVRTKIFNEAGNSIGTDTTVNISTVVFNTTDNSNSYEFYAPTTSIYGFKKFSAIKTIEQCRDIDYITDAQIYVPDLISGTDVTGNTNHLTFQIQTLESIHYDIKQEYLLKKGYVRYDSGTAQQITLYIPNDVNGDEVSITTPTNTTKDKIYAGSELYHNLADSLLVFDAAIFDRSNTTRLNASARIASIYKDGYYDAANPKRWHPSELNYLKNTFWFNDGYKESVFEKMNGGSLYGRNYIEQIISCSNKSLEDSDKVLSYCGDTGLMRSKTIQQSITEPAVPVLFSVRTIGVTGANLSISWGNGVITKLVCDDTVQFLLYTYPAAGTFEFRIVGELDKFLYYDSSNSCLDIDITEFSKAANIWMLSFGKPNSITGSINGLTKLKELWFYWPTVEGEGLSGSINNTPLLEALEVQGNGTNLPIKNVTGRFENIPKMKSFCNVSSIYGSIDGLKDIEYFSWSNPNYLTQKIWGDLSDKTKLWCYYGLPGSEDVTGNTINLIDLEIFQPHQGITKPANLQHMTKLCEYVPKWDNVTVEEVNQWLADIKANREVVRTHYKNTVAAGTGYRRIELNRYSIPAPTGQGITDRDFLRTTVSPAIPGDGVVWTVLTN